jgi:ribA/ribD-fused uncharacterized protein
VFVTKNTHYNPKYTMHDEKQPQLPQVIHTVIDRFSGEFGFLSNFYEASLWVDGDRHPTVEHAYQAAKSNDPETKKLIREARSPYVAKRLGQAVQLPADWDTKKVSVMRTLVKEKFKNPLLRSLLMATESATLVENNTWGDKFWGVCGGVGQNWLGRILEEVRDECRREEASL